MNGPTLLASLRRRVPESTADDLFLDLPYAVFGQFAGFIIERMRRYGLDDPMVRRSFGLINDLFFENDRETVNIIETTLFEQLADDHALSRAAEPLLEPAARESFDCIRKTGGSGDRF